MLIDFSTREGRREQGKLIQQAAEGAGFSLEALAREIGCSRALIYQYVSGATLAQPDRIQRIAECTGKPLLFFYGGDAAPGDIQERIQSLQSVLHAQLAPPDLTGAISTCEQIIALARQAGATHGEANARLRLANTLLQQGEAARALVALDQAIPFFTQFHLEAHVHAAEQSRGHALLTLGRTEEAEAVFTHVAACEEWSSRWQGSISLAAVAEQRGQYRRALELLDQALHDAERAPDIASAQTVRLYATGNLANIHLACGDTTLAAEHARAAMELAVSLANRDQYLEALLTLGVCRREAGALRESRETLESALRWSRLSADQGRASLALAELAQTLAVTGRFDEARALGKDALQQAIAAGVRRAELSAQLALTTAYARGNLPLEARYHAAQACEISVLIRHPAAQAAASIALGEAHVARGARDEASKAFTQAAELADAIGARVLLLQAHLGLTLMGEREVGTHVLALARELAAPFLLWPALLACGQLAERVGELQDAVTYYSEAVEVIANLRNPLVEEATGDTYLEYRLAWEPYLGLMRVAREQGDEAEAARVLALADYPPLEAAVYEEAH